MATAKATGTNSTPVLSMTDIAALAGVQRPVITTWRRRHADFPSPISGTSGPLRFDAHEVCDWLVSTGRAERSELVADLRLHALTSLGSALPARQLFAMVTALICLQHCDGDSLSGADPAELAERATDVDPTDEMLKSEVAKLGQLVWLPAVVDELIEAAWSPLDAFERIMAARNRLGATELSATAVAPELARLIVGLTGLGELADRRSSVTVADPAAGPGDLLIAAVGAIGEGCAPVVAAAEADPYLARLARRRLTVHGVPRTEQCLTAGTDLDEVTPDVAVTQMPYAPAESRSAEDLLTAVDEVGLRLARGRSAAVLGPADVLAGALRPYSPADRLRADLLRNGLVEAVIRLPGGLVPFRPGYETAIWVLTSAYSQPMQGRVLLGDVSDRDLSPDVVDALVADVLSWRRDGHRSREHTPVYCAPADVAELTATSGPLLAPRRPSLRDLTSGVPATIARVSELEAILARLADPDVTTRRAVTSDLVQAQPARWKPASVGDLVRAGRLLLMQGSRLAPEDVGSGGHHAVLGPAEVLAGAAGARSVDRGVLAARYPRSALTEPGDVVVTAAPEPGAFVDEDGFSVVEFPARALRIPTAQRTHFTPRMLAALLAPARQGARTGRAVRPARTLEGWTLPLLAPALVLRYDLLLARLVARREIAQREIDALDEIAGIAATGLTDATLSIHE